jgi:hypothetical protein
VFTGQLRWLQTGVRPGASLGAFTTLSPRQPLLPVPYALALPGLWTQENATSPNLVGGYGGNQLGIGVVGATISGGGVSGSENRAAGNYTTVGGGFGNVASASEATVAGGSINRATGGTAAVGGGGGNQALGLAATVAGGAGNIASGDRSTVGGGTINRAAGEHSTVGGGGKNTAGNNDGNPTNANFATVSGGGENTASGPSSTVGGGWVNTASGYMSTVAGGDSSSASGPWSAIGGGYVNTASGAHAAVAGGQENTASGEKSAIGGGLHNSADGAFATIAGGEVNQAAGRFATVGGGSDNSASGQYATVPGGRGSQAAADYSMAAGRRAKAFAPGCNVWADSTGSEFACNAANTWMARASGGAFFYTSSGLLSGVYVPAGGSAWSSVSDVNRKENIEAVNGAQILASLADLPIATWNYMTQEDAIRHIGPMAQDFYAAFGVGESDLAISTIDADGVALAAIQALNAEVQAQAAQLTAQQAQIEVLEARLAALEAQSNIPPTARSGGWTWALGLAGMAGAVVLIWQRRAQGGE